MTYFDHIDSTAKIVNANAKSLMLMLQWLKLVLQWVKPEMFAETLLFLLQPT